MHVAIVGPGNMGRALTPRLLAGGNQVLLVGERQQAGEVAAEFRGAGQGAGQVEVAETSDALRRSEVVVLALPYAANLEFAGKHGAELADRIVVDVSNPLNENGDALVTEGGVSAAESIRAILPANTHVVKAFNTVFARTLLAGEVSGQPLDVFIAGDDAGANETVGQLVRGGGMRPVVVGRLERARQLEALGFLGIAVQQPLGTGFMTGWKLVFPGTEKGEEKGFPRNAVVGVLSDTGAVGELVTELAAIGVQQSGVQLVMGAEGVSALRNAGRGSGNILGSLGFEAEHTRRHLQEVEAGHVVVIVAVENDRLGDRVGAVLARHGATFINYYSRWSSRRLVP